MNSDPRTKLCFNGRTFILFKSKQNDISDVQKKLDQAQAAKNKLAQKFDQIKQSVTVIQKDISTTQVVIQDTAADIARKEDQISNLNDQIELQKELLKNYSFYCPIPSQLIPKTSIIGQ